MSRSILGKHTSSMGRTRRTVLETGKCKHYQVFMNVWTFSITAMKSRRAPAFRMGSYKRLPAGTTDASSTF